MVRPRIRRGRIGAICAALGTLASVTGQVAPPQQPVFRSTTDLVPVDVVVVDKGGQPIRGLHASDFQLFDRRQTQAILAFEEVSTPVSTDAAVPPLLSTIKKDVADNRSAQSQRLIVLVVDDLHIYRGRTDVARKLAGDIVDRVGPGASMALLFTSGEHSTQVTEDRSELLAAVETLKGRQVVRRPHEASDKQTVHGLDPEMSPEARLSVIGAVGSGQDFFDNMAQYKTLEDAARLIGTDTVRRKAFVVLSEGINKDLNGMFDSPITPCELRTPREPQSPCYHDRSLRTMMESLRRSNVTTYFIDPRGHVSSQDLLRENFPAPDCLLCGLDSTPTGDDSTVRWNNPVRQAQAGLGLLAEASGGFAITDTDDFAGGLARVFDDLDHYYLLGFRPSDPSGKDYRPIDVTVVGHPEWVLRFRKRYLGDGPPSLPKGADPLLAGVMPKTDLPLRLLATALPSSPTPGKVARIALALEVTAPVSGLQQADGSLQDDVTYQVLAIDEKKAKAASREGHTARLVLRPRAGAGGAPQNVSYQIQTSLDLPPGRYQLRASAASGTLAKSGSVYLMLDVPDFTARALSLSGVLIGYADGPHVAVAPASPSAPTVGGRGRGAAPPPGPLPFAPSLDREFQPSDMLRVYFEIVRSPPTPVQVTLEIVDAQGRAVASLGRDIPASASGLADLTLPLGSLLPGPYALRATATSGRNTAQETVGLRIR